MSAKPRCKECKHKRGPRVVSHTSKRNGAGMHPPRQHKKPCGCECHTCGQSNGQEAGRAAPPVRGLTRP